MRRLGLMDFWQNLIDDTYDFVDDTLDRVRDDDWDDLEDDVEELREAVAALSHKLDLLLQQGGRVADVRASSPADTQSLTSTSA